MLYWRHAMSPLKSQAVTLSFKPKTLNSHFSSHCTLIRQCAYLLLVSPPKAFLKEKKKAYKINNPPRSQSLRLQLYLICAFSFAADDVLAPCINPNAHEI